MKAKVILLVILQCIRMKNTYCIPETNIMLYVIYTPIKKILPGQSFNLNIKQK